MLVIGVLVGCGSKSPQDKCIDLADEFCKRAVECVPGGAGMQAECEREAEPSFGCNAVKSVTAMYDTCMSDFDKAACDSLFVMDRNGDPAAILPDSCVGVLVKDGPADPAEFRMQSLPGDFSDLASAIDEEPR